MPWPAPRCRRRRSPLAWNSWMHFQCSGRRFTLQSPRHAPLQEIHRSDDLDPGVLAQAQEVLVIGHDKIRASRDGTLKDAVVVWIVGDVERLLSLIHISEPTRLGMISYAVF